MDELKTSTFQTPLFVSHYNMGRDDNIYPNANSFIPERWLRENRDEEEIHPFASLPFSYGARSCLGKLCLVLSIRAETPMHMFIPII